MKKKKVIIIVVVLAAAAVIAYFILKNNKKVSGQSAPPAPSTPSNEPGSTTPSPVPGSTPSTPPPGTPVAIPGVGATFAASTPDAQVQGTGTSSDPLSGMPSGFVTWANSLGPQNRNRLFTLIPQMTSDEINLVNNIVTNNLWGNASVTPLWNNFVKKYGFPVGGAFSNFKAY